MAVTRAICRLGKFRRLELDENAISEGGVEAVKKLLTQKFGNDHVLGSMENNEGDDDDDDVAAEEGLDE